MEGRQIGSNRGQGVSTGTTRGGLSSSILPSWRWVSNEFWAAMWVQERASRRPPNASSPGRPQACPDCGQLCSGTIETETMTHLLLPAIRRSRTFCSMSRIASVAPGGLVYHILNPRVGKELDRVRVSIERGQPYGGDDWVNQTVKDLSLEHAVRPEGRPRKASRSASDPIAPSAACSFPAPYSPRCD